LAELLGVAIDVEDIEVEGGLSEGHLRINNFFS
jgi:hypothetical protein